MAGAQGAQLIAAINEDALTKEHVQVLLSLRVFVAAWANSNRDTSKAYNVLQKIYRSDTRAEVHSFFQCSWCNVILQLIPRGGTSPLLRHVTDCLQRPPGYILPEQNLNRNQQGNANLIAMNQAAQVQPNNLEAIIPAANSNLVVASSNVVVQQNEPNNLAAITSEANPNLAGESSNVVAQSPIVPSNSVIRSAADSGCTRTIPQGTIHMEEMANKFEEISRIGALYGTVTAEEMMSILPTADGRW